MPLLAAGFRETLVPVELHELPRKDKHADHPEHGQGQDWEPGRTDHGEVEPGGAAKHAAKEEAFGLHDVRPACGRCRDR